VFTNLFPDHLDRYECLEDYYADKGRIFENADEESVWVLPKNDNAVDSLIGSSLGRRFYFGEYEQSETHAFIADDILTLQVENRRNSLIDLEELSLLGQHNESNALAASLTTHLAGVPVESIADGLRSARPLPHRLELVTVRNGVTWINDSKATNTAATRSALKSLNQPIILLVGGVDKGEDFASLVPSGTNLRAILAYGEVAPRIVSEIENVLLVEGDMEAVTKRAEALAEQGDAVLLSPACSSFDMFDSYEDRGCVFSALAREST
jgi:UDP-N-acetylmuramoylalanine--D-glutamate ligase